MTSSEIGGSSLEPVASGAKEFGKQFIENVAKSPGWSYLLLITYFAVWLLKPQVSLNGQSFQLSNELWVTFYAYIAYQVGDALDKITFKKSDGKGGRTERYTSDALRAARRNAQKCLGIKEGSYTVALTILRTANSGYALVHFLNEIAKCIRSLILPGILLTLYFAVHHPSIPSVVMIALSLPIAWFVAWHLYPRLKALHIQKLYERVTEIAQKDPNLWAQDTGKIRVFLWESLAIATAKRKRFGTWPHRIVKIRLKPSENETW